MAAQQMSWSSAAILGKSVSSDGGHEAVCGEGDYGSDGFVVVVRTNNKKLVWLAAFDCSNHFIRVEFGEDAVYAYSTMGNTWKFPLAEPCEFTVE